MGFYIEVPQNHNKAQQLADLYGAIRVTQGEAQKVLTDELPGAAVICVVQNGFFDAAALIYNQDEFDAFNDPGDNRPRTWMVMSKKQAHELAGYQERVPA